jgi:hypothetical protein
VQRVMAMFMNQGEILVFILPALIFLKYLFRLLKNFMPAQQHNNRIKNTDLWISKTKEILFSHKWTVFIHKTINVKLFTFEIFLAVNFVIRHKAALTHNANNPNHQKIIDYSKPFFAAISRQCVC